jgi:hypothetical protein
VSLFLPYPPSSRSFIVIVDPSFYLVLPLSFFPGFLFLSRLAPADETAGMVLFPLKFQRDGSYIPSGLSGREPWPCVRKKFILSYLLLSSRPRVYRSLGKSLERPFSLFGLHKLQIINSLHFPYPRFLFPGLLSFTSARRKL